MDTFLQDLRGAIRSMAAQRALTATVVATLTLGIGATTAIFSLVNVVLLRPLPFPDPSRLVLIWGDRPQSGVAQLPLSLPNANDIRSRSRSLEALAVWTSFADTKFNLGAPTAPEKVQYAIASHELFPLLGAAAVRGRLFSADDDVRGRAGGVVVSERLWRRLFSNDADITRATVTLDGRGMSILGVLPPDFRFVGFPAEPDVWLPLGLDPVEGRPYARGASSLGVIARLRAGVTLDDARRELRDIAGALAAENPGILRNWTVDVISLREQAVRSIRPAVLAMFGAVSMVLLIACANVANLLLGRAVARRRELAVRAALGASRGRLVRQMLTESACLAALGATFGTLLASWLVDVPAAVAFAPESVFVPYQAGVDDITMDAGVLLFTIVVAIGTTVLVGLLPALRAARLDPSESLRGSPAGSDGTKRIRSALVVTEIALSVVLLGAAGLLLRSFARLTDVDPGFRPDQVLAVTLNLPATADRDGTRAVAFFESALERAAALPGVRAVGAIEQPPLSGPMQSTDFRIIGAPEPAPGQAPRTPYGASTAGYREAMGISLLAGRWLDATDVAGSARVAVVNEAFARTFFAGGGALEKQIALSVEALRFPRPDGPPVFDFAGAGRTIVGIVADVRQDGLSEPVAPMVYVPLAQRPSHDMTLAVLAATDPADLVPALRAELAAIDPNQPITAVTTMRQVVSASLGEPRSRMALATVFAALATVLTAVGVYGVISYGVTRRRHELGVRLALGAERGDVVRLVVREAMALGAAGAALGLAGGLVAARGLAGMLYEVRPDDATTFGLVVVLVVGVAIVASWVPAMRASRVNPVEVLRGE